MVGLHCSPSSVACQTFVPPWPAPAGCGGVAPYTEAARLIARCAGPVCASCKWPRGRPTCRPDRTWQVRLALVRPVARRAALSPRLRTRCRVPAGLLRALRHRAGGGSERARRGQVCGTSGRRPLSVSRFAGTPLAFRGCASAGAFLAVCSRVQPTRRGPKQAHALGRACFPTRPRVEPRGVCASTQTLARPLRPPDTRPQA